MWLHVKVAAISLGCGALAAASLAAADESSMTVAQVRAVLKASPEHADFSGKNLINLDLDGLAFRNANFTSANLFETSFRGDDLTGAKFDRAYLSATKFTGATLRNARFVRATFLAVAEHADFRGANLSLTTGYLIAPDSDLTGADLQGARLGPDMSNQPMGLLHTVLSGAKLDRANLSGANLSFSNLGNAHLRDASLRGTVLESTDLGNADFTGADLTRADLAKADLTGATFVRIRGRATIRGLAQALNVNQAVFR